MLSLRKSLCWFANTHVQFTTTVHVLQDLKQAVLSKSSQQKLGMLPESYPHARLSTLSSPAITNVETDSIPASSLLFPHLLSRLMPAPRTVAALETGVTGERKAADLKHFMTTFQVIFDGVPPNERPTLPF
jgi:hypothetical protein